MILYCMIKRENTLKRLRHYYDSEMIKVITGVRRSGKSILLDQIQEELLEQGVPDTHIISINFEVYSFRKYCHDPDGFYTYISQLIQPAGKNYLFFDEIGNMKDFELLINSFRVEFDCSIFITGSNSKLLSGELASHLGGRTLSFHMMPFSFSEFIKLDHIKNLDSRIQLESYLEWGGFPLVCKEEEPENKHTQLMNLKDSIMYKDIILRNKIKGTIELERLLVYILANSSSTFSARNIKKELEKEMTEMALQRVYDYIGYFCDAGIINRIQRYDIRGKKILSTQKKLYACDLGLFRLFKNRVKQESNLVTETLVYNELVSRGYQVYIGKTFKGEVDFIIENENGRAYIQAAYLMENDQTREREFSAFSGIDDAFPRFVISFDPFTYDMEGIRHIHITDFLLGDNLL